MWDVVWRGLKQEKHSCYSCKCTIIANCYGVIALKIVHKRYNSRIHLSYINKQQNIVIVSTWLLFTWNLTIFYIHVHLVTGHYQSPFMKCQMFNLLCSSSSNNFLYTCTHTHLTPSYREINLCQFLIWSSTNIYEVLSFNSMWGTRSQLVRKI